jgi:hypothetical protein
MKKRIFRLLLIVLVLSLVFPMNIFSKGSGKGSHGSGHSGDSHYSSGGHSGHSSGGHGGHYTGGSGSSHKGSHYNNSTKGNHYTTSGSSPGSSPSKSYKAPKSHVGSSYTNTNPRSSTTYHPSVKRDSKGRIIRSEEAKQDFLKSRGLKRVPPGYQVDHKTPLWAGGSDTPSNMQLLTNEQHKAKTKADYQRYVR